MLTKLGLKNFKVFEKEQELILGKKFTLIYGSNSSGKSSLFQAIQIIKETLNTPDSGFKYLGIQGEMNDFINKNNKSKEKTMNISFEAETGFTSRIRSFGSGSGLSGITRILDSYKGVVYPIKYGIDIKIKLDRDDAKLEKVIFKMKFKYDDTSKENFYDTNAQSVKKRISNRNFKEKEILILELEALDRIKKSNLKEFFPNFRNKYDSSLNNLTVFKINNIVNDDKVWKRWWEFRNKYLKNYDVEKRDIATDNDVTNKRIKQYEAELEELERDKKSLIISKNKKDADKITKEKNLKRKRIINQINNLSKRSNERANFRIREFQRSYPNIIVQELIKLKTYSKFKSEILNDIKKNLKFTSSYFDFSKNIGQFGDSVMYGYRSLNPIGDSMFEKLINALQFGRHFRYRQQLPLINISRFPEAILNNLNRSIFNKIFTVHSTESEFSDSYRMKQENYNSVGRDGKNTPYILIKNKKTLSSVNKTLKQAMNIELSLSKGRLQGENHFIFKAKDSFSGKLVDTVKMKLAGKGFNSIIPYLTEIMMHENSMILLEEIENSLHPKIISPLIDSLITVQNNNRYVLETHSKHIVLKLQQLVKNKKLDKNEVAINYIERKKDGSKINHIPLDENGDFTVSWPEGGFFPEESKLILG